MYFPKYKLAIECDENTHKLKQSQDNDRQKYIENKLDCTFIRYNPESKTFNIFEVINQIYTHIMMINMKNIKI